MLRLIIAIGMVLLILGGLFGLHFGLEYLLWCKLGDKNILTQHKNKFGGRGCFG